MNALRIAIALFRIPRLFANLFLFPILLSLVIIYAQLVVTGVVLKSILVRKSDKALEETAKPPRDVLFLREMLYGSAEKLPAPRICRWQKTTTKEGKATESFVGADCNPERVDVAIRVADPQSYDPAEFLKIFEGNIERLHICQNCKTDLVISPKGESTRVDTYSAMGLLVLSLVFFNEDARTKVIQAKESMNQLFSVLGSIFFNAGDLRAPIKLNDLEVGLALIFNLTFLVIVALWLALKAHRRVLDYFSKNGALLPMVAATGKQSFYAAIWILTLLRVGFFLVAAGPVSIYAFDTMLNESDPLALLGEHWYDLLLWLVAVSVSLGLATIIASIADLKHRTNFLIFTYRYIPILICFLGGILWALSFVLDLKILIFIREVLTALPLFGMTAILVAPVVKPQLILLLIHTLLSLGLIIYILKRNARWFAAHLEEL